MLVGICGLIGSGKGTVADILVGEHHFEKLSFADKLKDAVAVMFDWDREMLEGISKESREWREKPDDFWTKEIGQTITPRLVLQKFGTECMRDGFYDGIWVSLVKQKLLREKDTNFVIPDVRFENEAKVIKSLGGQVWCIKRGTDPLWFRTYQDLGIEPTDVHESEWKWANVAFDQTIYNDKDLEFLRHQVQGRLGAILSQSSVEAFGN